MPVEDIETHLLAHPAVYDVAIVGISDQLMGERACGCVIACSEPPTLAEIAAFLRNRGLAAYKLPDTLKIVESFP